MAETEERDKLSLLVAELQKEIEERERAMFSPTVRELARRPRNMGAMLEPEGHAVAQSSCGDAMEFFLRVDGSQIELAVFMTDGCGPTIACGSMLTAMVEGKTLEQAATIDAGDLIVALDGLPPEHVHCATLAVDSLRQAIATVKRKGETVTG